MTRASLFVRLLPMLLFCGASVLPLVAQLPPPPAATPEFKERPFGPLPPPTQAPPPKPKDVEPPKPIPREWLIGGGIAWVLAIAALLWGANKAWHSSNLFDRQYRFPESRDPALRLGGKRSGGHMATIQFGTPVQRPQPQPSEAKNA